MTPFALQLRNLQNTGPYNKGTAPQRKKRLGSSQPSSTQSTHPPEQLRHILQCLLLRKYVDDLENTNQPPPQEVVPIIQPQEEKPQ